MPSRKYMDGNRIWLNECSKIDFFPKIMKYPEGTKTSQDAAKQLGCDVSNIAKSIVFRGEEYAIVVITSGSNKVDRKGKLKRLVGYKPSMADSDYVLNNTGYNVGGVPPFGHLKQTKIYLDEDLLNYDMVWGAAGTSDTVFPIKPKKLLDLSGAKVVDVKQQ